MLLDFEQEGTTTITREKEVKNKIINKIIYYTYCKTIASWSVLGQLSFARVTHGYKWSFHAFIHYISIARVTIATSIKIFQIFIHYILFKKRKKRKLKSHLTTSNS